MSDKYAYVVIIALSYQFFDIESAFVITTTIYSALGTLSLLKSMLHEARPFFVADIKPTKCWFEYGNPSGHALTSSSLYLTVWTLACRSFNPSQFVRWLSLAFTLSMCFWIAFSRVYNGVHTYN